jgi:hypothetical protein
MQAEINYHLLFQCWKMQELQIIIYLAWNWKKKNGKTMLTGIDLCVSSVNYVITGCGNQERKKSNLIRIFFFQ